MAPYASSFYQLLLRPLSTDEDSQRKELILNIILCGSISFLATFEAILIVEWINWIFFKESYLGIPLYSFTLIYFSFVILLILSRHGLFRLASFLLLILYYTGATYSAYRWGPDLYQVILIYALIIIMSSILFDSRVGFLSTLIIAITIISFTILNGHGLISFAQAWKKDQTEINDVVEFSLTYLMISFISWLSNREITKSLKRARRSEGALQEQNKNLEQIVTERTSELRQLQAEKMAELYRFAEFGRLSSGVFHDLINPLSAVSANLNNLDSAVYSELPLVKESVNRAVVAANRMENFVQVVKKQLKQTETYELFSLNEQINEVILLLGYKTKTEGVEIIFWPPEKIEVWGNPLRLQQVVSNLICNALDSYENLEEKLPIEIRLETTNGLAAITVADRGCGIKEDILGKIFDPFFTTKQQKGVGLGLSTIKQITKKDLHGTIQVTSKEGIGSVFCLTFPIINESPKNQQINSQLSSQETPFVK